jgi:type II secretory pathway component PulF
MLERGVETTRQVRGALMYPACVVGVLVLAVTFLVGFVIPKFATMFKRHGSELPLFTKVLLEVGQSMQQYWWAYLLGVAAIVFTFRRLTRTDEGLLLLDKIAHRIPYVKRILIGIGVARFARILGLSLGSGLGLIEALTLAGKASGRPLLRRESIDMASKVRAGATLAAVLGESAYLTPFARRMLTAGERSSEIPRMCSVVSRHYEREASELTKNLSTVIEPVLVVAIAGVVLVVAMAIFLPMWDSMKMVGS